MALSFQILEGLFESIMFKEALCGLAETSETLAPRPVGDTVPGVEPDPPGLTIRPVPSIGNNVSTAAGAA